MSNSPIHSAAVSLSDLADIDQQAAFLRSAIRDGRFTPENFMAAVKALPSSVSSGKYWYPTLPNREAYYDLNPDSPDKAFTHLIFRTGREVSGGGTAHDHFQYVGSRVSFVQPLLDKLKASPNSVLMDIGCGRGLPVLLAAWTTGVRSIGVEFNKNLADDARGTAAELGLTNVEILHGDAFDLDYSHADAFNMFAPFRGQKLTDFLETKLRPVAHKKPICINFYGPGKDRLDELPWLEKRDGLYYSDPQLAKQRGIRSLSDGRIYPFEIRNGKPIRLDESE